MKSTHSAAIGRPSSPAFGRSPMASAAGASRPGSTPPILGRVDPPLGFRALLELLESDDPTTLSQALNELQSVVITADEDRRGRADLVVEPAELARMTSLLDHPDEKVVGATIWHSCRVSMRL